MHASNAGGIEVATTVISNTVNHAGCRGWQLESIQKS